MKVNSTPPNNNFISFKEDLLNVCLQIALAGTDAGDPSRTILEYAHYKRVNMTGTLYDRQLAAQKNYDDSIAVDDTISAPRKEIGRTGRGTRPAGAPSRAGRMTTPLVLLMRGGSSR